MSFRILHAARIAHAAFGLGLLSAACLILAPAATLAQQTPAGHAKHVKKAKHGRVAPANPRAETRSEPAQRSPVFEQHDARQGY